jgi:hypothetical protein
VKREENVLVRKSQVYLKKQGEEEVFRHTSEEAKNGMWLEWE